MAFYVACNDSVANREIPIQQGDIVDCVPFLENRIQRFITLEDQTNTVQITQVQLGMSGNAVSRYNVHQAIVVSQTCDLTRGKRPITLARVIPVSAHLPEAKQDSNSFDKLWNSWENAGKLPVHFPLPPDVNSAFPCSIANLLYMQTFAPEEFDAIANKVVLRLSPDALAKFQERLWFLYGRYAAPTDLFSRA